MTIGNELKKVALKVAYKYLDKDPETNIPKLMDWVDRYVKDDILVSQRRVFREIMNKPESNWYKLISKLWTDIDGDVRKTIFENIVINANALATIQARESKKNYKCNIPWALAIDMTRNENTEGIDFDKLDEIIEEAKDLGTFMFIFVGENTLDRKKEIIALCNKHEECEFMFFTSGREIDEDFAFQMLRVKNLIPAIFVDGTKEDEKLDAVMRILSKNKLAFGTYCFYNEDNMSKYTKEEFYHKIIGWGGKFCFFFSSVSEERDEVYPYMVELRDKEPLLTINFCKDKGITGGCVAGGKYYCFINSAGDVQPCVFLHNSDSNIYEGTLLEAYKSPLFMGYIDTPPECKVEKKIKYK